MTAVMRGLSRKWVWRWAEELTALDEVSRLPREYPGWMFERQGTYRAQQLAEADRRAGHVRGTAD